MSTTQYLATLALCSATLMAGAPILAGADEPPARPGNHWLLDLDDDDERFARIEQQLGGFSNAMWAVGVRYRHAYDALIDDNLALAAYHWEKLGDSVRLGYVRRPARQAHADVLFLDGAWRTALEAFSGNDLDAAREAFLAARGACMACHVAENVPFMNDQPLFRETVAFR